MITLNRTVICLVLIWGAWAGYTTEYPLWNAIKVVGFMIGLLLMGYWEAAEGEK